MDPLRRFFRADVVEYEQPHLFCEFKKVALLVFLPADFTPQFHQKIRAGNKERWGFEDLTVGDGRRQVRLPDTAGPYEEKSAFLGVIAEGYLVGRFGVGFGDEIFEGPFLEAEGHS